MRTCIELYVSATSAWVKVFPQSELMGPEQCRFCAFRPYDFSRYAIAAAIDVLIEV